MSFDIFFQPCRFGTVPVEQKNPFTGEVRAVLPVEPLTADELRAVREVLERSGARGPDEHNGYAVAFGDGGAAEVFGDLGTGCMVAARGALSPGLLRFLFDLLRAADWAMLPAMEGNPAIVASPGLPEELSGSFPEVVCTSAEGLGELLGAGFRAWERYRDRVAGDGA